MRQDRRDVIKTVFKIAATIPVASFAFTGTNTHIKRETSKTRVVIIGGGIAGTTVAKRLLKKNESVEVYVIDKNDFYIFLPTMNKFLSDIHNTENLKKVDIQKLSQKVGYNFIHDEVTQIDRSAKVVSMKHTSIDYDLLVMATGIEYDYENQFPVWSRDKLQQVMKNAPAVWKSNNEYKILQRQLEEMMDGKLQGDIVITIPHGKSRSPATPYERATMLSQFLIREKIPGRVIILNYSNRMPLARAFKESWEETEDNRILHMDFCKIDDVDVSKKIIYFTQSVPTGKRDSDGDMVMMSVKKMHSYAILNLIPDNKTPSIISDNVKTTSDNFHKIKMNGATFQTATDKDVYAVGDIVGHALPATGQTAIWSAKQVANEITERLHGRAYNLPVKANKIKAANVGYYQVNLAPEEAIMVTHDFSWTGAVIKGKGWVPKALSGKYRSNKMSISKKDWEEGVFYDTF